MGIEVLLAVAAVAGTGAAVYGQHQAAEAAEDAAEAQGRMQAQQAGREEDAAEAQAEKIRRAARAQVGEARAALSASGVSAEEGSALKIQEQIIKDAESDALNTIISGNRGSRTLMDQAGSTLRQGRDLARAGRISAVGTALQGASSAFKATGWRSGGAGYSGTQAPAPVVDRSVRVNG